MEEGTSSKKSSGPSYDVFLSFRGADTRHGFTDHLYHDMVKAGIVVFRDDESLHVGEEIGGALLQAIANSKIYVPIFSTNYASSHWCLRELAYMVECTLKSNRNKEILPIFLDVEPADVKLKTKLYSETLSKCQKSEAKSWEKALIEVGKIKGWNLNKDESQVDLIQSVIEAVLDKLNVRYKNVTEHLVGVDDRVEAIIKILDVESDSVKFLAIHGMGGVGKTTLAKVIFNRLSSQFQGCNFLSDVRESSERHGLVHLQKQLLSEFHDSRFVDKIKDVDDGINMIKRVLHNKKVLIVLDDVHEEKQLKHLAKNINWFGSGSRIILTTRYKSVLMIDGEATDEGLIKSANVLTYEVQEMEFHHALKLFSMHAFRRDSLPNDYVSLSKKVVSTLGKLPLALEIIGSSLFGRSKELWVDTLKKLRKAPPEEVQKTLRITYERLDYDQRQVFLDIACFFVNENKTYPCYLWNDCDYCPHNAIEVLCLMSLIKIKDDNTFWMHDQVRDLGRAIVREENFKEPHECSRVWNHQEALSIMEQKKGSEKIEALSLGSRGVIITPGEVANLQHLRFLNGNEMFLVGDFNNLLPNLRWLSWRWCPFEFVATNFHLVNLVVLDLSHSYVSEKWIGWNQIRVASKLKVLDLSNCNDLMRTPDLSMLVSLERLILEKCRNLIEIDPSIGKLKLLTALNLNGCDALEELPYEIGWLDALTEILMPHSWYAFKLPETIGYLKSLLTLDVSYSWIHMLPYSIKGLVKLRRLNLFKCLNIKFLPHSVGQLHSLVELDLSSTSLEYLPNSIGQLQSLVKLDLSSTSLGHLPDSIGQLQSLVELDLSSTSLGHLPNSIGNLKQLVVLRMNDMIGITKLPREIWLMEKLEELEAGRCHHLTGEIPEEIGTLSRLRILDLSFTCISGLPTTMRYLCNLQTLNLESCSKLNELPELPPSLSCLRWAFDALKFCGNRTYMLEWDSAYHSSILHLYEVEEPTFGKTVRFWPRLLSSSLRELEVGNLAIIPRWEYSLLSNLSTLRLQSCLMSKFLDVIPEEVVIPKEVKRSTLWEKVKRMQLKQERSGSLERCLLESLKRERSRDLEISEPFLLEMKRLRHLEMRKCQFSPGALRISHMKILEEVNLFGCSLLVEIWGLEELGSLCFLSIVDCSFMERMSNLSKLRKLRKLRVGECPKLRSVEGLNHLESLRKLWIHDCCSLESLADTSNLRLECSTIEHCKQLPNCNSYCRCRDNRDSDIEPDHAKYF